ncbi:MAG: hypothetical protein HEQ29_14765 [Dolichospermum sp. LBC05a]|nr:hypothetical protein [Dolichospermum sp. OL01]MCO5797970.1 hypothetical protein [Dolichospermum sp. OL03]MCS6282469.1 hypothetical protein [Dolichospermum sp.]QSV59453.1 MAG: hypothetical protein HEQ29_14765 [Dolichospermum sp. LBC05a]
MDPISLIIAALVAGAAAATKDTAGKAVKDTYEGLKTLIKKRFESKPEVKDAQAFLDGHEKDPETYEKPLKKKLVEAGAKEDEKIIQAAQKLLKEEKPEEFKAGKYNVQIAGDFNGFQGDISGGTINQNFS